LPSHGESTPVTVQFGGTLPATTASAVLHLFIENEIS
jgi:hypothetical protein